MSVPLVLLSNGLHLPSRSLWVSTGLQRPGGFRYGPHQYDIANPTEWDDLVFAYPMQTGMYPYAYDLVGKYQNMFIDSPLDELMYRSVPCTRFEFTQIILSGSANENHQNVTVCAWVALRDAQTASVIIGKQANDPGNGYPSFSLRVNGNKNADFYVTVDGTIYLCEITPPPLYEWHHWCGTYDGEYNRLYIDGILVNQTYSPGTFTSSTVNVEIGKDSAFNGTLNGYVCDCRMYKRALALEEIQNIARAPDISLIHLKQTYVIPQPYESTIPPPTSLPWLYEQNHKLQVQPVSIGV